MRALIMAASLLALTGCGVMPTHLRVEVEHVSHPLVGWPCTPQAGSEDGLSQLSGIAAWRGDHAYAEAGLGYNLEGRNGGGIYGPALTGTVRVGYEWRLR
jgi:hypothetical protein